MDITSLIGTLLSSDSVSGVSKTSKTSSNDVQSILAAALPALLSGAQAQAEDKSTAAGFAKALATHGKKDTTDVAAFLSNVDLDDGTKIINHLLSNDSKALDQIAEKSGASVKTVTKVLSAAAPLLMSLMGQKENDDDDDNALGTIAAALIKNVDVGGLVGSLLGGASSKKTSKKSSKKSDDGAELLGSLLGSLLK